MTSFGQPSKGVFQNVVLISRILPGRVIDARFAQDPNAYQPMEVKPSEKAMARNDVQSEKAQRQTSVIPSGRETDRKDLHLENEQLSIRLIPYGIVTVVKQADLSKACWAITIVFGWTVQSAASGSALIKAT